jgi:hypothetical protein
MSRKKKSSKDECVHDKDIMEADKELKHVVGGKAESSNTKKVGCAYVCDDINDL